MANRSWASGGKIYSGHIQPVLLDCNFVVDSANGNGLGIRSLKGPYVQNVFMHTSASPGLGNANPASPAVQPLNPNPAAGYIVVQMQDAFMRTLASFDAIVNPVGSSSNSVTANNVYILTSLGTATNAQLQAAGIPSATTPAVGIAFVAASTGALPGSATAAPTAPSGIARMYGVGDSNVSLNPYLISSQGYGAQIIIECRNYSDAVAAPADGTVINLNFLLSNSGTKGA